MADPGIAQVITEGGGGNTKYYELAGIALSLIQMIVYLFLLKKYVDKLEDLGEQLTNWADEDLEKLKHVHGVDDLFHNWYNSFFAGSYEICDVDILRAKGSAFRQFGKVIRNEKYTNTGYTPLAMLRHVENYAAQVTSVTAVNRASAHVAEEERFWKDLVNRWDAHISRPINRENEGVNFNPVIENYVKSMNMFGKGFNSAGIAFGNALYQYLRK